MSLFIRASRVVGIYAFGQWFEVEEGTLDFDAYDLAFEDEVDDFRYYYEMGAAYGPPQEIKHYRFESSEHMPISPHLGIAFHEKGTCRRISFSTVEVKAFKELV